jgi:osmotically-inducible protein OsmY
MLKKSVAQTIAIAFVMTLFLAFSAAAATTGKSKKAKTERPRAAQTNCSRTTGADLVKAVRKNLSAEFKQQMNHVNISVKNRTVKLEGWLSGKASVTRAFAIAKRTRCLKTVVSKLKTRGGGNCGPGQKPCGDICIDKGSECTIVILDIS